MIIEIDVHPESVVYDTCEDKRVRHYVERVTAMGVVPPQYSKIAICGAEVKELVQEHSEEICQACIDKMRSR